MSSMEAKFVATGERAKQLLFSRQVLDVLKPELGNISFKVFGDNGEKHCICQGTYQLEAYEAHRLAS